MLFARCTLLPLFLFFSPFSRPSWSIHRAKCSTLPTFSNGFTQFARVSIVHNQCRHLSVSFCSAHLARSNVFLSSEAYCSFGFPDKIPCCTLQWNNFEFWRFTVLLFPQDLICLGPIGKSHARRSVSCCTFFLQKWTFSSMSHKLVLQFLLWCTHCLGVLVAFRFFDGEECASQVKLNVQGLSRLWVHGSTTEDFSHSNLRIQVFPCLSLCILI